MPLPQSLADLKKKLRPIRNVNIEHKEKLTRLERVAVWLTDRIGTMSFFFFCLVMVTIPLIFPTTMPVVQYISSGYLQLILLPLIMVGQNLQGRHAEARAEADFEINTKAEQEIEAILLHLENQNDLILKILQKLEMDEKNK
jgi:hypothetical protein